MTQTGSSGARLTDAQRLDWLRLIRTESVGPQTFRSLINRYGGAAAAIEALPGLAAQRGRTIRLAETDDCLRELDGLAQIGGSLVALGEPEYPAALREVHAPPPMIAMRGKPDVLTRPMVAVIGSRNASVVGLAFTERVVRDLAAAGFVIVSGLARGIDARAHIASLAMGTLGVLAGGLDKVYPPQHEGLARDMLEHGALISEMPLGWEPQGRDFPRRNRIVAGVALGTLVIEAARGSGSLITAKFAAEQGREVFAVPGSPLDPRAEGTNALLKQGATLCTSAQDVLDSLLPMIESGQVSRSDLFDALPATPSEPLWDELDIIYPGEIPSTLAGHEFEEPSRPSPSAAADVRKPRGEPPGLVRARIEAMLGPAPVPIDDLVRASDASVTDVRIALLELEFEGRIERHGAGLVSLIVKT
jgi:DNA processing protein